ncbi:hypothetical protein [Spiroplasma endosymbiont of Labia minor]|uniref:hypothetical protein n=1 Tax=Spiroplasma endosymbiont of Labia minor TaxID=3066305 RepID=UPI0030D1F043
MAKNINSDEELKYGEPKKNFFNKLFNKFANQKKIMLNVKQKNIKNFLFYTDVNNIIHILEYGIKNINSQKLQKDEIYTVWTYLEHDNSIGVELDTSTRAHFWKWASDNDVDVNQIAVIGINPYKLVDDSTKDWAKDETTNIIYIYDNIPINAIDWIMIKDKHHLKQIRTLIDSNNINVDVYFGSEGNLLKGDNK